VDVAGDARDIHARVRLAGHVPVVLLKASEDLEEVLQERVKVRRSLFLSFGEL
jgi:hypothetical protein